jgi:predicted TIM-barrel fold metal-dependent hydrolase
MLFFDCSCVIGRRRIINPGSYHDTNELVRKLKYYGIEGALAYHSMAREYSPSIGNQMLLEEISSLPFFKGVWVIMPHHTGEFPEPPVLREEMKKNNIKAVRMFPSGQGYTFSEWCCGDLFGMLEECRIPLMMGVREATYSELYDVMFAHPEMRVILTDLYYSACRNLYPLLKKFEHIYVETIGYKIFGGIEEFCRLFGADRLVFGSGMPVYSGGSATGMINYARISDEEKHKIASGNLERLLGGVML